MQHILYLHGFLSSPSSVKAQATKDYFAVHHPDVQVHIPALSNFPSKVEAQLTALIEQTPALLTNGLKVIGSSMGGYLSTFLIEKYAGRAVLINPAVRPYELLQQFIGPHVNPYSGEKFTIEASDIDVIRALDANTLSEQKAYKVLLQTNDETLDYRHAAQLYRASPAWLESAGSHSFEGFIERLPQIFHHISRCLQP